MFQKKLTNHEQVNKEEISVVITAMNIVQRNRVEIKLSRWMVRKACRQRVPCEICSF